MLENSQMREGMLLQATDDVLRGELQRLRAELGRLAGSMARPCAPAVPADAGLAGALDELRQAIRDADLRLARLESAGTRRAEEAGRALDAVLRELHDTRADLRAVQGWAARRWLPAGKDPAGRGQSLALSRKRAIFNGETHTQISISACTVTELTRTRQGGESAFQKHSSTPGAQAS
jgi:hypothetical protein